jgi:hypothetical protein
LRRPGKRPHITVQSREHVVAAEQAARRKA